MTSVRQLVHGPVEFNKSVIFLWADVAHDDRRSTGLGQITESMHRMF